MAKRKEAEGVETPHYVIFSESRGVFLNFGVTMVWSGDPAAKLYKSAPCMPKRVAVRVMKGLLQYVGSATIKECYPDAEYRRASEDACARIGIKRWL